MSPKFVLDSRYRMRKPELNLICLYWIVLSVLNFFLEVQEGSSLIRAVLLQEEV